ncbi:MAG: hypothetical protein ACPGRZ_17780 [Alphaproteobacteria bacterium]
MAKSPSPWSVKGVDPEAREAAKIAARKAGLTVGAWLNQMIRQAATDQLRSGGAADQGHPTASGADQFADQRPPAGPAHPAGGDGWGGQPQQPPQPGTSPPPAPTIQAVFESIQRLSSRIEDAERRTSETIAPIAEKVAELSEQIEQTKGAGGASTAPVERAVQKIADRLDKIESGRHNGGRGESREAPRPVAEPREPERKGIFGLFRRD